MRACAFNEMADKLHGLFEIGKVINFMYSCTCIVHTQCNLLYICIVYDSCLVFRYRIVYMYAFKTKLHSCLLLCCLSAGLLCQ